MTPEQRVDVLKDLLGRLRSNADGRLELRSGDEEEFVPRSVLEARKLAAEQAEVERLVAQQAAEQQAAEQRAAEQRAAEQQAAEQQAAEQQAAEQRAAEQQAAEQQAAEQQAAEQAEAARLLAEQQAAEQAEAARLLAEQEAAEQAEAERFLAELEAAERRAAEQKEAEQKEAEQRAARPRFVPDDARLDTEPPPTAIPGGGAGSLEEELRRVEESALSTEDPADLTEAAPPVAPAVASAPPLELELYDSFDEPTATGVPDDLEAAALASPAGAPLAPVPPMSTTRAVSARPPSPSAPSIEVDDGVSEPPLPLDLSFDEETQERPTRARDPLASTAQNPVPAALFERAVLGDREVGAATAGAEAVGAGDEGPDLGDPDASSSYAGVAGEVARGFGAQPEAALGGRAPTSTRAPVDPDREADADLESEPPPQSGEVASQRKPAARADDLDAPTPETEEGSRIARQAEVLSPEALPSAPPATRPAMLGRRILAASSFVDILDVALALAEDAR